MLYLLENVIPEEKKPKKIQIGEIIPPLTGIDLVRQLYAGRE
jgi:hypothetical protein